MSEILTAGPDLNALVAETVMGWTPITHYGERGTGFWSTTGSESDGPWIADEQIPAYSTDISAAWEIVERLRLAGCTVRLCGEPAADLRWNWRCTVTGMAKGYESGIWSGSADTPALAICLAALRVLGALR